MILGLFYTDRHSGAVKQTEHGVVLKLFAKVLSIYLFIIMTDHLICSFSLARVANMSSIYHFGFSGSPKRIQLKSIFFSAAVDCGSLSAPRNGSSLGNFTVFPNELLFYCDPGFLLGGSSTRTCQANGTWSGIETICTRKFKL